MEQSSPEIHSSMELIQRIVAPLEQDNNTLSIVLVGSAARGQLDAFSDLDIHVVVRGERPPDQMFYLEPRLVNINFVDRENRESMLTDPWKALHNIGAAREAQILFDPEGWYANLQQRARAFVWKNVQAQADISISWVLAQNAEEVQKILGGLQQHRLEKVLYALWGLLPNLANVAALANGVLTNSENVFWSSVRCRARAVVERFVLDSPGLESRKHPTSRTSGAQVVCQKR
jgi:predicted nucleotidyltransferase